MKYLVFPAAALLLLTGCVTSEVSLDEAEVQRFRLADALSVARYARLETDAVASLGKIATEHIENRMLLSLPALYRELRGSVALSIEEERRILEDAISFNFLTAPGREGELLQLHHPRVDQLLQLEETIRWVKLGAEEAKLRAAGESSSSKREELRMLLRVRDGISNETIDSFDYSTLAVPVEFPVPLDTLQRYGAKMRSESQVANLPHGLSSQLRILYRHDPAAVPMLCEALYRLPRKLEELRIAGEETNLAQLAALGSALGIAVEIELSYRKLLAAWGAWRNDPALPETLADWQVAYYRLMCDLGVPDLSQLPERFEIPAAPPVEEKTIRQLLELMRIP